MPDTGLAEAQHHTELSDTDPATAAPTPRGMGPLFLRAITFYQGFSAGRPPRCRYLPTCSEYAHQAILTHGSAKGSWLAVRRLCRCHPFGSHGFDPVPAVAGAPAPAPSPESS